MRSAGGIRSSRKYFMLKDEFACLPEHREKVSLIDADGITICVVFENMSSNWNKPDLLDSQFRLVPYEIP
jgi:hypothetical protein